MRNGDSRTKVLLPNQEFWKQNEKAPNVFRTSGEALYYEAEGHAVQDSSLLYGGSGGGPTESGDKDPMGTICRLEDPFLKAPTPELNP